MMKKFSWSLSKKHIRIIIWSLFGAFFLFVCLPLLFFYTLFDQNKVRNMIINQINNKNYSLQINGSVEPRSWHGLSLFIADMTILDKANNKVMHVNTTNCQLSWIDLIFGRYSIRRVAMNGLTVYQNNVDKANYSDLFNYEEISHSEFKNLKRISINNLNAINSNGDFIIKDAGFMASDIDTDNPSLVLNLKFAKYDSSLSFDGKFHKSGEDGNLNVDTLNMRFNGNHYNFELQSGGHYDVRNQELWLEGVRGNVIFPAYKGSVSANAALLSLYGLTVNDLKATVNNIESGINKVIYVNAKDLRTSDFKSYTADNLIGEFDSQSNTNTFISTVRFTNPILDENMSSINQSCQVGYKLISKSDNQASIGSLKGSCTFNGSQSLIHMDLAGAVDKSSTKLNITYDYHNELPLLQVQGSIDKLDIDKFINSTDSSALPLYQDARPLPFNWISWLNADVNLNIKQLGMSYITLNNVTSQFSVNNSVLFLKHIEADTYDGKLTGSMTLSKNTESYNVLINSNVTGVNLQKVFNSLFNVSAITGNANVVLSSQMNGIRSYKDFYNKLTGKVAFSVANGGFSGIDFNMLLSPENLAAFRNQNQIITSFTSLSANFAFESGVSDYGDIQFSSPTIAANGKGKVDFVNNKLDYNMEVKSILPSNSQNIKSVLIPIAINGDLFSPKIYIKNMTLNAEKSSSNNKKIKASKKNAKQ